MKHFCTTRVLTGIAVFGSLCFGAATPAWATPITLVANTVNMFRDTRGINDVGLGQGDRFQFGACPDGELVEVDIAAERAKITAKREQGAARTMPELIALGVKRGYASPIGWARNMIMARGRK